jgi:dihydrofolate reductase
MTEARIVSIVSIVIIVAAARNGVIGRGGDMPWRLPTDLKHFKALTLGKPVVMGRRTWTSIGRPLPGRPNIVVTRDATFAPEGAETAPSLDAALALARAKAAALGVDTVCVIGGGEIYSQALALADVVELTVVEAEIDGDTRFPSIDPEIFDRVSALPAERSDRDSHAMTFTTWVRRSR